MWNFTTTLVIAPKVGKWKDPAAAELKWGIQYRARRGMYSEPYQLLTCTACNENLVHRKWKQWKIHLYLREIRVIISCLLSCSTFDVVTYMTMIMNLKIFKGQFMQSVWNNNLILFGLKTFTTTSKDYVPNPIIYTFRERSRGKLI